MRPAPRVPVCFLALLALSALLAGGLIALFDPMGRSGIGLFR